MFEGKIIPGYRHQPGFHCASSAIRNLLAFRGINLSEPAVIGLGRAPGFLYGTISGKPSRYVIMRHLELEANFFTATGVNFQWQQTGDASAATQTAMSLVERGFPVLIQTDIAYLPYFKTDQHFIGHAVVICGCDGGKREFYVSDTLHPEMLAVPFADMERARSAAFPPFDLKNRFFVLEDTSGFHVDETAVAGAIRRWAGENLDGIQGLPNPYGIKALEKLITDLPHWHDISDWQWSARFTYQVIERRGTGGAGFRTLYRQFLEEEESKYPQLKRLGFSGVLAVIENLYHELAAQFRQTSEKDAPDFFAAISVAEKILERERILYGRILKEL